MPPAIRLRCAKCQVDGHHLRNCKGKKPWPQPGDQECDFCWKQGQHEPSACPERNGAIICDNCGHGYHTQNDCRLRERTLANVNQYTPAKHAPLIGALQPPSIEDIQRDLREKLQEKRRIRKENRERWISSSLKIEKYPDAKHAAPAGSTTIRSNFFEVKFLDLKIDIRRHHVVFGKIQGREVLKPDLKRTMIEKMLAANRPTVVYGTDYFSTIISVGQLYQGLDVPNSEVSKVHNLDLRHDDPPGTVPPQMTNQIVYDGKVNIEELNKLIHRDPSRSENYLPHEDLRSLNIVSWQNIYPASFLGGRVGNKFFPRDGNRKAVAGPGGGDCYVVREGFFSSMRPGDQKLLLNVNPTVGVFFPSCTLHDWIRAYWGTDQPDARTLMKRLRGLKVTVIIRRAPERIRVKKRSITGISSQTVERQKFKPKKKVGEPQKPARTVWQHVKDEHKQTGLKEAYCINTGSIEKGYETWYPSDMLQICDWQVLDEKDEYPQLTRDMLQIAKKEPNKNQSSLRLGAMPHLGIVPNKQHYQDFGLRVLPNLLQLGNIRTLTQPSLEFKGFNHTFNVNDSKLATWGLEEVAKHEGFFRVANPLPNLCFISLKLKRGPDGQLTTNITDKATIFGRLLSCDLPRYGFGENKRHWMGAAMPPQAYNRQQCRKFVSDNLSLARASLEKKCGQKPPVIIVLLDNEKQGNKAYYSDVKWWSDCVSGTPTVCVSNTAIEGVKYEKLVEKTDKNGKVIRRDTLRVVDYSLLANVVLKINAKLKGTSHVVRIDNIMEGTIIMGADVTHSGSGLDRGCPSLAGVVGTRDHEYVHYLASARLQSNNTEFIERLEEMVVERLEAYYSHNNCLPKHILFYRDGVGDTQYGMVHDEELPQIRKACDKLVQKHDSKFIPQITLIVVGKRHHARFFPNSDETARNLTAGLVVDKDVVPPNQTSFYLQGHDCPIGTARTAHYVVIVNQSDYKVGDLENITNRLCFTGSRATKALSTCTPVRYADILCTRLRCYMQPVLSGAMTDVLNESPLDDYRGNPEIWGSLTGNPWKASLNDIMFYL